MQEKLSNKKIIKLKSFGLIEIIVALGVFLIIIGAGTTVLLSTLAGNQFADEQTEATLYAREGIEAAKSIQNRNWTNISSAAGNHGISNIANGYWEFSGTSNTNGKFTRVVNIAQARRDGSNNIVDSGGTLDSKTYKVTSTVTWNSRGTQAKILTLESYLTYWEEVLITIGNWALPTTEGVISNLSAQNALKVQMTSTHAFVVTNNGSPEFASINITTPATPSVASSQNFGAFNPSDISLNGNYLYMSTTSGAAELQVLNVTNPASVPAPTSFNSASGTNAGLGIYSTGNRVYLGKIGAGGQNEFAIINITTPTSPADISSLNIANDSIYDIVVIGNYAYLATGANAAELQIVNITNEAAPVLVTAVAAQNLGGTTDALTITGAGNYVFIGQASAVYIFDVTNPANVVLTATIGIGGIVNDITLGNSNNYLFVACDTNTTEFRVYDVTDHTLPTLLGSVNHASVDLNGVAYNSTIDRAVVVGDNGTNEFMVIKPS